MKYIFVLIIILVFILALFRAFQLSIKTIKKNISKTRKNVGIILKDIYFGGNFFTRNDYIEETSSNHNEVIAFAGKSIEMESIKSTGNTRVSRYFSQKHEKSHFYSIQANNLNRLHVLTNQILIVENRVLILRYISIFPYLFRAIMTPMAIMIVASALGGLVGILVPIGGIFFSKVFEDFFVPVVFGIIATTATGVFLGGFFLGIFFDKFLDNIGKVYYSLRLQSMESLGFEKSFDAFSKDPIEARMLITPAFMDRLEEFSEKWNLKGKIRIIWEKDTFTLLLKGDIEKYGKESDGSYTLVKSMEEILNLSYYSLPPNNTNNA